MGGIKALLVTLVCAGPDDAAHSDDSSHADSSGNEVGAMGIGVQSSSSKAIVMTSHVPIFLEERCRPWKRCRQPLPARHRCGRQYSPGGETESMARKVQQLSMSSVSQRRSPIVQSRDSKTFSSFAPIIPIPLCLRTTLKNEALG